MSLSYEISKLAKRDLEEIWRYIFENWSVNQADRYYKLIIKELDEICADPEIGKSIDYIKVGHRIRRMKSHVIVYKIEREKIWIDRILHKGMDIETRLGA